MPWFVTDRLNVQERVNGRAKYVRPAAAVAWSSVEQNLSANAGSSTKIGISGTGTAGLVKEFTEALLKSIALSAAVQLSSDYTVTTGTAVSFRVPPYNTACLTYSPWVTRVWGWFNYRVVNDDRSWRNDMAYEWGYIEHARILSGGEVDGYFAACKGQCSRYDLHGDYCEMV